VRGTSRSRSGWRILASGALLGVLAGCGGVTQPDVVSSDPRPGADNQASSGLVPVDSGQGTSDSALTTLRSGSQQDVSRAPATPTAVEPPDAPASVEISAARISAEVVPVGIADDGQMELPPDPDVLGWYRFGPAAGDGRGSVVLAGHVDSLTHGVGQLARLTESKAGDEVLVHTDSGQVMRYTVVDVRNVPKSELPLEEVFKRDGDERLLLITCGGEFDRRQGSYSDNIVVTAVAAARR
jgi:LPXTG-site transpeptidase (sortase) family protein